MGDNFISGLLGGISGLISTGYNLYTNKRDFDYQKALQNQLFQREDTAVQRRVEDLKAAGLNPALANGSAAGAGSVVSRSNTNDVNFGATLDAISAVRQIQQQKIQTENLRKEGDLLDKKNEEQDINNKFNLAQTLSALGIPYDLSSFNAFGKQNWNVHLKDGAYWSDAPRLSQLFDYQLNAQRNSADMLQKELNAFDMDRWIRNVSLFMPDIYAGINVGKKLK